jgi:uncharacterized protein (DUF362 family)
MVKDQGKGAGERRHLVSLVRYERPHESVEKAVRLCGGLDHLPSTGRVFVKPNIVFWTRSVPFPKWGVITTSRVLEDVVMLLKERGTEEILIGEGIVTFRPKDGETPAHAFESLGYNRLKKRYGVRCVNIHERPFDEVELGEGVTLRFNRDFLESDFVVNLPVLKTHSQTMVSLGIKNLKGTLDMESRKRCHSADPERDLNFHVSRLHRVFRKGLTLIDGIYTNARGPGFDGKIRRRNILVASPDVFSADKVGARLLGYECRQVPHLALAAQDLGRPADLSDVKVAGEEIAQLARPHEYAFPYTKDGSLPIPMKRMGIRGISYRQYDLTICTYCSFFNAPILTAIARAWEGEPWDDVEVLTGKSMKPTPGKKKTVLIGKCIYQANKDDPNIREMIAVKGCPPSAREVDKAFHRAGISLESEFLEQIDRMPGLFMRKYEGKPEFDESLFKVR